MTVTGHRHEVVSDAQHVTCPPRWLDAPGTWSGGTMRANSIALGRLTSADVTRGMIGVPVRWRTAARSSRSCPDEWGVVTILADGPTFVLDPTMNRPTLNTSAATRTIAGLAARNPGEFVDRRAEQGRLPAVLTGGSHAGVVLTGIGGIGKTTLAAEVVRRTVEQNPGLLIAPLTGQTNVDDVLRESAAVRAALIKDTLRWLPTRA